jgi:hypothetical protein
MNSCCWGAMWLKALQDAAVQRLQEAAENAMIHARRGWPESPSCRGCRLLAVSAGNRGAVDAGCGAGACRSGPSGSRSGAGATAIWPRPRLDLAQSQNDFRVTLDASLRTGRNALYNDHFQPDHLIRLNARKTLLDTGRQQGGTAGKPNRKLRRAAAVAGCPRATAHHADGALLRCSAGRHAGCAETEALATAYVSWDNARDRQALGQLAQWELVGTGSALSRSADPPQRCATRSARKRMALGAAMNLPGMVLDDLVDPKLPGNERPLPEFDSLLERVLASNPRLAGAEKLLRRRVSDSMACAPSSGRVLNSKPRRRHGSANRQHVTICEPASIWSGRCGRADATMHAWARTGPLPGTAGAA